MRSPPVESRAAAIATLLAAASMATSGCRERTPTAPPPPPGGAVNWYDGRAELSSYALTRTHYGKPRRGKVVLVFVHETFSESLRVKVDPARHRSEDVFDVVKLNVVKDFQTGIYDYNLLSTIFVAKEARGGRPAGSASKIVFSSQEWCGALFDALYFDVDAIRHRGFSYFESEVDRDRKLAFPADGLAIDQLPLLVRGLPVERLARGQTIDVTFLSAFDQTRLVEKPLNTQRGTLNRSAKVRTARVPAGEFEVERWTAKVGPYEYLYDVETTGARRLIRWQAPDDEVGELMGSQREPYWLLNDPGQESYLAPLRLEPDAAHHR